MDLWVSFFRFWVILVLWCSYLCHLRAVHSEGRSVRHALKQSNQKSDGHDNDSTAHSGNIGRRIELIVAPLVVAPLVIASVISSANRVHDVRVRRFVAAVFEKVALVGSLFISEPVANEA